MLETGLMLQERYRIVAQLGQGGMGAVYRAWDTRLSIPVAIKEMIPQPDIEGHMLQDLRTQFKQEATVLARLSHPHLVGVTDFFEEGRNVYLVMKFVEGQSLFDRIQEEGAIPEEQVVTWCAQLLEALAYCHSQGIIHRDIKPQNIIIRPGGDAMLVDFGLVKLWNPNDPQTRTAVRGIGTPQYAPPEQYEMDSGHTEPRSDIYSLGATMYHAFTGQAPPTATLRIAAPEDDAPLRAVAPTVSAKTAQVIDRAMELARSKRWASPAAMADALGVQIRDWGGVSNGAAAGGAMNGRGGTMKMGTRRMAGARRWPIWLMALVALAGLAGLASLVMGGLWVAGALAPTETPRPTATATAIPPTPTATEPPTAMATATEPPSPTPEGLAGEETPTLTPSPTPEETPSPTPTETPEASPTPEATVAQPSPTPPPADSGAFITFEQWGTWRRGDQANGDLTQTQEQVKSGSYAAKLAYNFPASNEDYVVFTQQRALSGSPNAFAAWVYGDGSNHYVNLWIRDAQGEIWAVYLGRAGSGGWRQLSGRLAPGLDWPSGHISGPDNGVVDYPVSFYALVLDRPSSGPLQGTVYIDDISAWQSTAPVATPTPVAAQPTAAPTSAPPAGDVGSIVFTVDLGDSRYLYSTDPGWSQMVEIGRTDAAHDTCATTRPSTLTGLSFNLSGNQSCVIAEGTGSCPSPDGAYQVITSRTPDQTYNLLVKDSTGVEEWYYLGSLNRTVGIVWSYDSQYFLFGVNRTVHIVRAGVGGYQTVIGFLEDTWPPQFTSDSQRIFYLKPVGSEGASDVVLINVDGTGERNLTNSPITKKLCPRWRW